VLAVAVAAVLAGARSLAAIGEWASDAPCQVLAALGVGRDPWTGVWRPPGEATVRRVLARIDPDALDRAIGAWLADQQPPPPPTRPPPAPRPPRRAVAVDGKTLRGSGHHPNPQVHLVAAMDHTSRAVLAQADVEATTNEIARFRPLLDGLDLADTVVTADALHTQREHADWLVTAKHAAYLLIVKANQPTLHHQLRRLPWGDIPAQDHTRDRSHGRVETRRLQVTTVAGLDFPHATQAIRITRRTRPLTGRRWRTVTVHAVTSLTAAQAHPARLADYVRDHWGIEALHHIRDTTFAEDASRSAPAPPPGPWPAFATSPSASSVFTAGTTSPPGCAATPATPPESCHCWESQPMKQTLRHLAEALRRGAAQGLGKVASCAEDHRPYVSFSTAVGPALRLYWQVSETGLPLPEDRFYPIPQPITAFPSTVDQFLVTIGLTYWRRFA
jgi:predicted transposase YbfD/YdcC